MFRDLIESIQIFLDGREKLVTQIVIYIVILSGGTYFIFFYEWKEKILDVIIDQTITATWELNQATAIWKTDDKNIVPTNSEANQNDEQNPVIENSSSVWKQHISQPQSPSKNENIVSKVINQVKNIFTPDNSVGIDQNIKQGGEQVQIIDPEIKEEEIKEEIKIEEVQKEVIVQNDEIVVQNENNTATSNYDNISQNQNNWTESNISQDNTSNPSSGENGWENSTSNTTSWVDTDWGTTWDTNQNSNQETISDTTWNQENWDNTSNSWDVWNNTSSWSSNNTPSQSWSTNQPLTWDSWTDEVTPEDPPIEDYFNNDAWINTWDGYKGIKITVSSVSSPNYPVPNTCPFWYSQMWVYSNITSITTLFVPYSDSYGNTMSVINEYETLASGMKKLYKVFIVNGIKNGAVIYKSINPNQDYYRAFSICLEE